MTKQTPSIDMRPEHFAIVRDILRRYVPDREVWAFGSRARGKAKPYSDLDLAIIGEAPLSLDVSANLAEALSESDLPYKVDIVDWATIDDSFREIIRRATRSWCSGARVTMGRFISTRISARVLGLSDDPVERTFDAVIPHCEADGCAGYILRRGCCNGNRCHGICLGSRQGR